ncbi:hypothetical protein [Nocardioides nanhaiensis]|uniref:Secreted protein n=1 Tax=Nocardioides nanhaiensis TaxID=1476871 RepID=A0ABP8WG52_9ACTN
MKIAKTAALTTAGALLAVPTAVLVAAPAHADVDRQGRCGPGSYEFSVDREGRGFEVSADLDNLRPGSRWKVVLRQDGRVIGNVTRTADREGDVELDRFARNTAGKDRFVMRATPVGGGSGCSSTITVS